MKRRSRGCCGGAQAFVLSDAVITMPDSYLHQHTWNMLDLNLSTLQTVSLAEDVTNLHTAEVSKNGANYVVHYADLTSGNAFSLVVRPVSRSPD